MTIQLYSTGTEYFAVQLTEIRGTTDDIASVWVYLGQPNDVPTPDQFTQVQLVEPGDPLAEGDRIDILTLAGPGDVTLGIAAGQVQETSGSNVQLFAMVVTATEIIIRSVDEVEFL